MAYQVCCAPGTCGYVWQMASPNVALGAKRALTMKSHTIVGILARNDRSLKVLDDGVIGLLSCGESRQEMVVATCGRVLVAGGDPTPRAREERGGGGGGVVGIKPHGVQMAQYVLSPLFNRLSIHLFPLIPRLRLRLLPRALSCCGPCLAAGMPFYIYVLFIDWHRGAGTNA